MFEDMPMITSKAERLQDAHRLQTLFSAWQNLRKAAGRSSSQAQAARMLGMGFGQSAFSQYLQGRIPLNVAVLVRLARLFNVHPAEISPRLALELEEIIAIFNSLPPGSAARWERSRQTRSTRQQQGSSVAFKGAPRSQLKNVNSSEGSEGDWPFPFSRVRYLSLSSDRKARIEGYMLGLIDDWEKHQEKRRVG